MKKLLEALAEILELAFVIALTLGAFWVFRGDPNLWDKWHAQAMQGACKSEAAK